MFTRKRNKGVCTPIEAKDTEAAAAFKLTHPGNLVLALATGRDPGPGQKYSRFSSNCIVFPLQQRPLSIHPCCAVYLCICLYPSPPMLLKVLSARGADTRTEEKRSSHNIFATVTPTSSHSVQQQKPLSLITQRSGCVFVFVYFCCCVFVFLYLYCYTSSHSVANRSLSLSLLPQRSSCQPSYGSVYGSTSSHPYFSNQTPQFHAPVKDFCLTVPFLLIACNSQPR